MIIVYIHFPMYQTNAPIVQRSTSNTDTRKREIYLILLLADLRRNRVTVLSDSTTPRSLSNHSGIRTQSSLGKRLPQETGIRTSSPDLIGLDNGVSGIKE